MSTPILPPGWMYDPTVPSVAARADFFAALARPRLAQRFERPFRGRRSLRRGPSAVENPAPVFSRSSLTSATPSTYASLRLGDTRIRHRAPLDFGGPPVSWLLRLPRADAPRRGCRAFDDGFGDGGAEETDRPDGVVVARDLVVDHVGVAVGVDHRHDRNAELVRLLDRDLLLLRIDHEERVGELAEALDAAQGGHQLFALVAHLAEHFLLGEGLG